MITTETIQSAQAGDSDAMWEILTGVEPMMLRIIATVTSGQASANDRDDLLQEARAAMITRVHAYDTTGPASLQTRAYREVHGAVARAWVSARSTVTPEPEVALRVRRALGEAEGDVEVAARRLSELPADRRVSRSRFMAALEALTPAIDLEAQVNSGNGRTLTLAEVLPDTHGEDLAEQAARRDLAVRALASVTPRRELVLRASYGVGMPPMEDAEIGGHLGGVAPARVRRIRWDGIQQARAALSAAA
ncbi:helix-turn-helix domain-containing protein [Kitasatospora sp. NPDC101183]|uniref:helix-turn-helix domain-containing protein n=1 Tax=Kitasatospora sp. NPDC101183 TaxID=3364100 RepID=UPI0038062F9B